MTSQIVYPTIIPQPFGTNQTSMRFNERFNPLNLLHKGEGPPKPDAAEPRVQCLVTPGHTDESNKQQGSEHSATDRGDLHYEAEDMQEFSARIAAKVMDPDAREDSDEIINKVDVLYKEFTVFQGNLKELIAIYKKHHSAMKTSTETKFDTAKKLDAMFGNSPIASAVAKGSPSAPPPRAFFSSSLLGTVGDEEFDYSKSVVKDEENVEEIVKVIEDTNPFDEREMAIEELSPEIPSKHPPTDPHDDPPADVIVSDSYPKDEVQGNIKPSADSDKAVNVIVDDNLETSGDFAPAEHKGVVDPVEAEEPGGGKNELVASVMYSVAPETEGSDPTGEKNNAAAEVICCETTGPTSKEGEPVGEKVTAKKSMNFNSSDGAELRAIDDDDEEDDDDDPKPEVSVEAQADEHDDVTPQEISNPDPNVMSYDLAEDMVVEQAPVVASIVKADGVPSTEPQASSGATAGAISRQSYFDVHEASYIETKKYLHQHDNLVKYVEDWERVLFQRVHALYTVYMKHRKDLQHYIKKMDSLNTEMSKLQKIVEEKEKTLSPKKVEKLDRNVVKLAEARATHDSSGTSLYLFLDEAVYRSWRDVFPMLQRAVKFEQDYVAMQANIFGRLKGTAELLELIARNQSASRTSRLKNLKTMKPELIYSGGK